MDNSDNEQDEFAELTPHQLDLLVQLQDLTGKDGVGFLGKERLTLIYQHYYQLTNLIINKLLKSEDFKR